LRKTLEKKAKEFDGIIKTGRTHLQDAVPIRLGQEFGAYAGMMKLSHGRTERAADGLKPLCVGGTAVGTGLNAGPEYRERIIKEINKLTGQTFEPAENMFEAMQSMDAVVELTGALRVLVTGLRKIADDLRLLSSGPRTGLAEIKLPERQPGSSIMPGKINPVMAEMLDMVCFHALGCDTTILTAAQAGQLELNVMMPVIAYNLLQEIEILTTAVKTFSDLCVDGIIADPEKCRDYAERSTSVATALSPMIGYEKASQLAKEAFQKDLLVRELVTSRGMLDPKTVERVLDLRRMTEGPSSGRKKGAGEKNKP
jgi:aspartate ammonia-lyase